MCHVIDGFIHFEFDMCTVITFSHTVTLHSSHVVCFIKMSSVPHSLQIIELIRACWTDGGAN